MFRLFLRGKVGLNTMLGVEHLDRVGDITRLSQLRDEPAWLCGLRLKALALLDEDRSPPVATALLFDLKSLLRESERHSPRIASSAVERAHSDSVSVFQKLRSHLAERGVIIEALSKASRDHAELIRPHLTAIASNQNNEFAPINSALWTEGWFVHVPRGVQVELPLQIPPVDSRGETPCDRTLIVCEEGSRLNFLDGCVAPVYTSWPMLASVVEIVVKRGAHCRYTSLQNGSHKTARFDTMRARAHADAVMEWNVLRLGGERADVVPCTYLIGPGARTEIWAASYAAAPELRTTGGHAIHCAPGTSSRIINRIVRQGGSGSLDRSRVEMLKGCRHASTHVECEALLLSETTSADLSPKFEVDEPSAEVHQSTRSMNVQPQDALVLRSDGLSREQALAMRVSGFLEPFTSRLPKEYAVEVHRWIELAMEGSVG